VSIGPGLAFARTSTTRNNEMVDSSTIPATAKGGMYRQDARMLQLIGLNHQAFDKKGVTRVERERRRAEYKGVLKAGLALHRGLHYFHC